MITESQDDLYFARMASSIGDKERILEFVNPGKVLDVGAGGGELSEVLRLNGNEVWALDGSSEAINRIKENYPLVHRVEDYSYNLRNHFKNETFDTIICSSILHEVYSYGDPKNGSYSTFAVVSALMDFYSLLKPGGVLIIRDGVMPTEWNKKVTVHLKTDDAVEFLEMYKTSAPYYSENPEVNQTWSPELRKVNFVKTSEKHYEASLASAMEFLYTLTWGWKSAKRETKELYGVFTESLYNSLLQSAGFNIEYSTQYLQPGYPENLLPISEILDENGERLDFPSSNMILVGRKN